jgi:hypothetical protein
MEGRTNGRMDGRTDGQVVNCLAAAVAKRHRLLP